MLFRTFRARRTLIAWLQAVVVVGLPFLRINGESAFRFDIPSLTLFFFGNVLWISEFFFVLLAVLFFFFAVMLVTVLYGRIWCGWMCPQTVLSDIARFLERTILRPVRRPLVRRLALPLLLLPVSAFVAATLIWYFVSPSVMLHEVLQGTLGPWTGGAWAVCTVIILLDLAYVRQRFCTAICPYARFQSAFFDDATLTIAYDRSREDQCGYCDACVRACPAGIAIKDGLQVACINCAACIDACARQMKKRDSSPLIGYFRGTNAAGAPRERRPRIVWLSLSLAAVAAIFIILIAGRVPAEFWVFRAQGAPAAGITDRGQVWNTYSLIVENHSLHAASYDLTVTGIRDLQAVHPGSVLYLPPNSRVTTTVYIFAKRRDISGQITQIRFRIENTEHPEIRLVREAPFIVPFSTDSKTQT